MLPVARSCIPSLGSVRCRLRRTAPQPAPYRWLHRCAIMMAMRARRKAGRQALVMSVLWRVLVWLLVLTVLACAIGGWGLPDDDPLVRVGAVAFAIFLGYIAIRFEMMLRSATPKDRKN